MPAGPHFVTQPIPAQNILIFDINHQQRQVILDQIEMIKNDNANYAPCITWKVLPMAQVAIFKEIFDQVKKRFRP